MLKVLISIPNTMPLPTPNPRKTHTAALWALQMVRLPLSIMLAPGVTDSLFVALQMAVQGKLGREGKKGSTSEGLTVSVFFILLCCRLSFCFRRFNF